MTASAIAFDYEVEGKGELQLFTIERSSTTERRGQGSGSGDFAARSDRCAIQRDQQFINPRVLANGKSETL
jgi:hypothetical protein